MEFDAQSLPVPDRYKLLIGCIVPRPIAWVSTIAPASSPVAGSLNLAPFSFFAGVGSDPMTLLFCPANKPDGSEKDSLRNAQPIGEGGSGEFVVNLADESLAKQVALSAEPLPYGESEFDLTGLHTTPSIKVAPPRLKEAPVSFECRTMQVIRTNPGAPAGGNIVIGEVLHIYVRDDLINERFHTDPDKLKAIGRMGGIGYVRTSNPAERFEIPMGRAGVNKSGH